MEDFSKYAIVVIYPDGILEKINIDQNLFHIQYIYNLAKQSERIQKVFKSYQITIPKKVDYLTERTNHLDMVLAKEGIAVLHNLALDDETLDDETLDDFYVTLPLELTYIQKNIINHIFNNFKSDRGWFANFKNETVNDLDRTEINELFGVGVSK